jgi:hypothetical protein
MNIVYNSYYSKVELQIYAPSYYTTGSNAGIYLQATGGTWNSVPKIIINSNAFANIIGFVPSSTLYTTTNTSPYYSFFSSTSTPLVGTKYMPLHYKPKNPQFGQQGAVSASSLITRIKYDSITTTAGLYTKSIGSAVANALAYGTKDSTYTLKDKIGYPLKITPIINKYNGKLSCCKDTKITGGM